MNKIIKIKEDKIIIGTEGGGILEVRLDDIDFEPIIGDEVDVFRSETDVIVTKTIANIVPKQTESPQAINISISNENASNNSGAVQGAYVGGKVVSKIAYILLAVFLGSLGIHKFYAGRTGSGILYLLFCWTFIPGFIGIIEGIVAAFKTPDVNGNIVV